jgi:hypothetical protein
MFCQIRHRIILFSAFIVYLGSVGNLCAGPFHDEAMEIVKQGENISDTGNLDAAMAEYDKVQSLYPEEHEAILWAKYRKSECLVAGYRWNEARGNAEWIWDAIQKGLIQDEDAKFWGAFQYARCLDHTGGEWDLPKVADFVLETYTGYSSPDQTKQTAAGWCLYWRAKHLLELDEHGRAAQDAEQAWELAKAAGNGTLAAWSRLAIGDAVAGEGNLLLARSILDECEQNYAPYENGVYRVYLQMSQNQLDAALGLVTRSRDRLMTLLVDEKADAGSRIRSALEFVDAAMLAGATMEALAPLAIIHHSLRHVPIWGPMAEERWIRFRRQFQPSDLFTIVSGAEARGESDTIETQAVRLELCERLIELGATEEALRVCDTVEGSCSDDRFRVSLGLLRAQAQKPIESDSVRLAVEELLQHGIDDDSVASYLVGVVRHELWPPVTEDEQIYDQAMLAVVQESGPNPEGLEDPVRLNLLIKKKVWESTESEPSFGEWLDSAKASLPLGVYGLEKTRWLRDRIDDCTAALSLANGILVSGDPRYRFDAYVEKIVCLYRLRRNAEAAAAVEEFFGEVLHDGQRDQGLYNAVLALQGYASAGALCLLQILSDPERMSLPHRTPRFNCLIAGELNRAGDYQAAEKTALRILETASGYYAGEAERILGYARSCAAATH